MMNALRPLSAVIGVACLAIGWVAALSGGGTVEQIMTLGYVLIVAGAILIAGGLISSAISDRDRRP